MDNKDEQIEVLEIDENNENNNQKKMGAFNIFILIIYIIFSLYVLQISIVGLYYSILSFDILELLFTLLITGLVIVPYVLLYKSKNNKDLIMVSTIYEIVLMVLCVVFFYFIMWPAIKSTISNQWCGIDGCM